MELFLTHVTIFDFSLGNGHNASKHVMHVRCVVKLKTFYSVSSTVATRISIVSIPYKAYKPK